MALPANSFQNVVTYQESGLAFFQNLNCFVGTANTRFKDFDRMIANLGDTVSFDLPPRFTTRNSLVVAFQPVNQRVQTLTVNKQISSSFAFSAQQFIFNAREYMEKFGKGAIIEIAADIESDIATLCVTNTFRFYGDGVIPINSYGQLAQALAFFRNFSSVLWDTKGYLEDMSVAAIVNSGLNQFALERNDRAAFSWEVGEFSKCEWYQSNLLPVHIAGSEGQFATTLTVVSTTLDADGAVIAITFSGTHAAADANSIKQYDKLYFLDGVAGFNNMRYLTFVGHKVSANPVQFRATADAASTGGSQVTVNIYPPLQAAPTNAQNLNQQIQAGMQVKVLPSHRAGLICSGDPLFVAMPQLPEEIPFPTGNQFDPDTGVSIRQYYGSRFGENQRGMVYDAIWGKTLVDENSMMIAFPL